MAAKKGSQNAKGNKGGGRKSAYQERKDASFLWDIWLNPIKIDEINSRIKQRECSISDLFIAKALSGSENVIMAIFNKLYPDNLNLRDPDGAFAGIISERAKKAAENYANAHSDGNKDAKTAGKGA